MRMLSVDTATEVCGIGLSVDGVSELELILSAGATHTKTLMEGIHAAMALVKWKPADLDALAVTCGPGSFTGLRIGISTMKGMAYALGKPLIGVSTLEVLAAQAPDRYPLVSPLIDARRKEVYWALFQRTRNGLERICQEQAGTLADVIAQVDGPCLFIGNGAALYADLLREKCRKAAFLVPAELNVPRPAMVGRLADRQLAAGSLLDLHAVQPVYLRKSDAELGRRCGSG